MSEQWFVFYIRLIVTGEGERQHLPKLFKSLEQSGFCEFKVLKRVKQLSPITSSKRLQARIVGTNKGINSKNELEFGIATRQFLNEGEHHFVIVIDDLEHDRRIIAHEVFERHRSVLDTILKADDLKRRASVHFLVNMLEAYYFADSAAVNKALQANILQEDYDADVEDIRHPKNELKRLYPGFDEKRDAEKILAYIDLEHVLARPQECASLRTLFAWCVKILEKHPYHEHQPLSDKYQLPNGKLSDITKGQLANL